jgi:hypothetical protein
MAAIRKIITMRAAVDFAVRSDTTSDNVAVNEFTVIRGDELLIRWTLFRQLGSTAGFSIDESAGLEFVAALNPDAVGHQICMYSDDGKFISTDWTDFDRANGMVSCRVSTDTTNLIDAMSGNETRTIPAALIMTPAPTSLADHVVLWQGAIVVRQDVYRIGEGTSTIVLNPPSLNSSSSSTEALTTSSSSSSSSSSTVALTTSSSSSLSSSSTVGQSTSSDSSSSLSSNSSSSTESSVPYADYANTVLLAHMNGSAADTSSTGATANTDGTPTYESSPAKFTQSINMDSDTNRVNWSDNAAFTPGTNEAWCIDFWLYWTTLGSGIVQWNSFGGGELSIILDSSKIRFIVDGTDVITSANGDALTTSTWYHCAFTFAGGAGAQTYAYFLNGVLQDSGTSTARLTDQSAAFYLNGSGDQNIDEFRYVIGNDVFPIGGFTPNSVPYPDS